MSRCRVFVNHYDCISCAGENADVLFENICSGRSGIKTDVTYLEGKALGLGIVAGSKLEERLLAQVQSILDQSNLTDFSETLLVVGSSVGGMRQTEELYCKDHDFLRVKPTSHIIDVIARTITQRFAFHDDLSFSTACTSSANALGYAYEVIAKGIYKNVLVVGFDTICKTTVGGFNALGVLSSVACRPFDKARDGMNVAEASALLLLQDTKNTQSVEMFGVGYSSDAHHMTQPHPDGEGAFCAMQNALTCKGVSKEEITYINAHGTGTQANDRSELTAIDRLFGTRVHVSSTKSVTGHTLGAAGALEAIIAVKTLQEQILPPTANLQDPEIEHLAYVRCAENKEIRYVLSNSFAFGGNNTSLLFGRVQ